MARTKVKILAADIKQSRRHNAMVCPIATRLKKMGYRDAVVLPSTIYFNGYSMSTREFRLGPRSVRRFVKRFDAGKPVKPFAFFLDLPAPRKDK